MLCAVCVELRLTYVTPFLLTLSKLSTGTAGHAGASTSSARRRPSSASSTTWCSIGTPTTRATPPSDAWPWGACKVAPPYWRAVHASPQARRPIPRAESRTLGFDRTAPTTRGWRGWCRDTDNRPAQLTISQLTGFSTARSASRCASCGWRCRGATRPARRCGWSCPPVAAPTAGARHMISVTIWPAIGAPCTRAHAHGDPLHARKQAYRGGPAHSWLPLARAGPPPSWRATAMWPCVVLRMRVKIKWDRSS
jgi:hypothetical protein